MLIHRRPTVDLSQISSQSEVHKPQFICDQRSLKPMYTYIALYFIFIHFSTNCTGRLNKTKNVCLITVKSMEKNRTGRLAFED